MEAPLFVKIEQYEEIMKNVRTVEEKLRQAEETLKMLRDIKQKEEQQFQDWEREVDVLKDKLKLLHNNISGV